MNTINLHTKKQIELINITEKVNEIVKNSNVKEGVVTIFSKHTTTGIRINENEERLFMDIKIFLEKIASTSNKYLHDDIELRNCPKNERINGHAHIKSLILNSSEIIPIVNNEMVLGKWQSIFFIELDGKRNREVIVQTIGK